jgi:hypothetical protein
MKGITATTIEKKRKEMIRLLAGHHPLRNLRVRCAVADAQASQSGPLAERARGKGKKKKKKKKEGKYVLTLHSMAVTVGRKLRRKGCGLHEHVSS